MGGPRLTTGRVGDAHGPSALEDNLGDVGACDDREVAPPESRPQICIGRTPTPAAALIDLEQTDAVKLRAVEIVVAGNAGLRSGLDEGDRQRIGIAEIGDIEWTADAVKRRRTPLVALRPLEIRKDLLVAPARAGQL